jgi:two-component system, OmpR family, sensor histidine kinase MtrB
MTQNSVTQPSMSQPPLNPSDGETLGDRLWSTMLRVRHTLGRPFVSVRHSWRSSLHLRVVLTTLTLSLVVLLVLAQFLLGRVTAGLLSAKERSALDEARAGLAQAQLIADAADSPDLNTNANNPLVEGIVSQLANRAGNPSIYEVLLLSSPKSLAANTPEFGSNQVAPASVPAALRTAVRETGRQSSTYTEITYADGRAPVPGFVVGAPLALPKVGSYELYYLFPLNQEQDTLSLVKRTLAVAGIALVLLLGCIAWLVTRQVVSPVRMAARTAERFSAGRLEERMAVEGEDDLSKLATSFNQMAGSLQGQIRQLEDLSRVQRRFVSDVSHELRTPLTTVRMAADVLHDARQDFDPATARSAELLQNQLDRFELLLTDLLEISRYDAGAAVLEAEPVDIVEVARRAMEAAEPLADRKGSDLSLEAPATACIAEVDARRVSRILSNLVVNAVEHGEGRPVVLTVAADSHSVAVAVRDHGVGLRPGEAALVFNRFWRADPARARTTGGTGLGLAIALEDAHLHGGWLQGWGVPGDGCNFRLTLPRRSRADLDSSPLPLEPADARADRRVPLAAAAPVRRDR